MICRYEPCTNDAKGNSKYCSKSCRAQHNRRNKQGATQAGATANNETTKHTVINAAAPASLEDYHDPDGRKYIQRLEPDRLNWGRRMNMNELNIAGLKANRAAIPGDWDYISTVQPTDSPPQATQGA